MGIRYWNEEEKDDKKRHEAHLHHLDMDGKTHTDIYKREGRIEEDIFLNDDW